MSSCHLVFKYGKGLSSIHRWFSHLNECLVGRFSCIVIHQPSVIIYPCKYSSNAHLLRGTFSLISRTKMWLCFGGWFGFLWLPLRTFGGFLKWGYAPIIHLLFFLISYKPKKSLGTPETWESPISWNIMENHRWVFQRKLHRSLQLPYGKLTVCEQEITFCNS